MGLLALLNYLEGREERKTGRAAARLENLFAQEDRFGNVPVPSAQHLDDYERVVGQTWPKRELSPGEDMRMQRDAGGGTEIAVNVPEETLASPLPQDQRLIRNVLHKEGAKDIGERAGLQRTFSRLRDFLGDAFTREDILHNMGLGKKPADNTERWGEMFEGPRGSILQRSSSGKVRGVVGPAGADATEKDRLRTQQAFRNQTLRLYGASDLSSLDENLRSKVNEISTNAYRLYLQDPAKDFNQAISHAFDEVEGRHSALDSIPVPNRGVFNNYDETMQTVRAMSGQVSAEEIARDMIGKGWKPEEAMRFIMDAGGNAAGSAPAPRRQGGSRGPSAGDNDLQQQYNALRRQGLSREDAARRLGIPLQ